MATLNDFKLVNNKAIRYANYLNPKKELYDNFKKRFGFYILVLENISGIKDIDEIIECIIDNEFCNYIFDERNDDLGVDAITIDDDNKTINLYNFKFRDKFKVSAGQKVGHAIDTMRFLTFIDNESTSDLTKRTKKQVEKIIEYLNSDEIWKINLFMVSNENNPLPINDQFIEEFKQHYEINVISITLDNIISFMSKRPIDINAELFVDASSVMIYEENELSSSKSYLIAMSLLDLIRITCSDKELRTNSGIHDFAGFEKIKLDLGILFDNVRGYLGQTKFNKNILKTLTEEPTKFFMYNNGITMTAKNIIAKYHNGNKKLLMTIEGFQIVNGGQTLRTIYEFKDKSFDETKLTESRVLVRIFQTEDNNILTNNIAEFTNSQNAISNADLKSVSNLQIQIEMALKENDILYVRKVGDTGEDDKQYKYRISMERMAQIIYSKLGYPDRATNQKKRLFETYYDEIFNEDIDFNRLADYVIEYYSIQDEYKIKKVNGYEQKYFYVLYLNKNHYNINYNIDKVEKALMEYRNYEDLSDARKLIQKGFKELLDKRIHEG